MAYLTVTTQVDVVDPSDGQLSLREALVQANASALLLFRTGRMGLQMKAIAVAALLAMAAPTAMAADIPPGASTAATFKVGFAGTGGVFEYDGDVDAWRVNLELGKSYIAVAQNFCRGKSLALFDRSFKKLVSSWPATAEQEAGVEYTATYTGVYFVQITDKGVDSTCTEPMKDNEYSLLVEKSCAPNRTTKCVLVPGVSVEKAIWTWNDRDWFAINITKAGTYTIVGYGSHSGGTWPYGGTLSLRRADTSVITETGPTNIYECFIGYACIHLKLAIGKYYVAMRMPLTLGVYNYQLAVTRDAS